MWRVLYAPRQWGQSPDLFPQSLRRIELEHPTLVLRPHIENPDVLEEDAWPFFNLEFASFGRLLTLP